MKDGGGGGRGVFFVPLSRRFLARNCYDCVISSDQNSL